jgi:hypothetical protein
MSEPSIRAAIDVAASMLCDGVRKPGDQPCQYCRGTVRDVLLAFFAEIPAVRPIMPVEMRIRIQREGADA